jgi:hypothetical protein
LPDDAENGEDCQINVIASSLKATRGRHNNLVGGALDEVTEEQSGFLRGCIVKSMYFDSSTVEFVDQPHA